MIPGRLLERSVNFDREIKAQARVVAIAKLGNSFFFGWNSWNRTSPKFYRKFDHGDVLVTRHAEFHLLQKIPRSANRRRVVVYVLRFNKKDDLCMAKPCRFCQIKLRDFGIDPRNVFYTDWDGSWKRLGRWDLSEVKETPPSMMRGEKNAENRKGAADGTRERRVGGGFCFC